MRVAVYIDGGEALELSVPLIFTPLNRDLLARRVQFMVYLHPAAWSGERRFACRGVWPRSGPWPVFRWWQLGPLHLRVWTDDAMNRRA